MDADAVKLIGFCIKTVAVQWFTQAEVIHTVKVVPVDSNSSS